MGIGSVARVFFRGRPLGLFAIAVACVCGSVVVGSGWDVVDVSVICVVGSLCDGVRKLVLSASEFPLSTYFLRLL